ncbi:MAG: PEP/pyruvate-binding domain-containing protein [Thermodesulfobacteriota bacterium]
MKRLWQSLRRMFSPDREEDLPPEAVQQLRTAFQARYHSFKLLLTANNKALEIMTDIQHALEGTEPFGMAFVRSKCTAVSVNVFRMIQHLDELAPGRYPELIDRFKAIQGLVNEALAQKRRETGEDLILPLSATDSANSDQVGGKMAHLAELNRCLGIPVPEGFTITASAFDRFLTHGDLQEEIDRRIQAAQTDHIDELYSLSAALQQLIIRSPLPEELEHAIVSAYHELEKQIRPGVRVSLRSSALGEDAAGRAFAGQFRSELNVSPENIVQAYKEVVAAKYDLPAITYRFSRGIPDEEVAMCVGCMVMIDAVAGGVMYSRNPLHLHDRSITINSVWGLPKAVVDGSMEPDVIVVSRDEPFTIIRKEIKTKQIQFLCYPEEGVRREELDAEKAKTQSITDEQALKLAAMAVRLDEYYGGPQDIEWALDSRGKIYILQCRHLQQWAEPEHVSEHEREEEPPAPVLAVGMTTGSPGVGSGPVFVVRHDSDKLMFPDGSVLVTAQARPRWAPLLSRAAAVITEVGGVAGHLANVAREFGVPALFGIEHAPDLFQNGQVVTVDADGLRVYEGRAEALIGEERRKKNLMEGSPVHAILSGAATHIVPLHLLDPDSPSFHPKNCESLHDITRFIHEKSVHEMFNFGKEHRFSERSSKQIFYKVPMQWWIINLDDGFGKDVQGKFVRLEDIVSIPMLAIWEGVIAIPWQGPPPVDTRGLMSILVQATTNPHLDPSMKSDYAQRNYFMVSKNFCSLQSRFGFHFSTIEALVGDRAMENYISFNFKGGAADHRRRINRAVLVAGILEKYGFRAEVKEDNVSARLEGEPEEFMKSRLKILGFLMIHTRQLDMVMNNGGAIELHMQKLIEQIESLVGSEEAAK